MEDTEAKLLNLHAGLVDFYAKHKPENIDEDVLTILLQFCIDAGDAALNRKLQQKYGEDLNTFRAANLPPPPLPADVDPMAMQATIARAQRKSLERELEITLPPAPKVEMSVNSEGFRNSVNARQSKQFSPKPPAGKKTSSFKTARKRKKKNKKNRETSSALNEFKKKNEQSLEKRASMNSSQMEILDPEDDPKLKLKVLDYPRTSELSARDLVEGFYSKFDESKLEGEAGVERFVVWAEQNSIDALSEKLKLKYGEGLFAQKKLARRRQNLETKLTEFYSKHDKQKLKTRWTILKILNWTMTNGVVALNNKFVKKYGFPVVDLELDI